MDILQQVKDKLEEMKAKYNQERDEEKYPNHSDGNGMYWSGVFACLKEFSFFVDHLEVKEVDLESEIKSWLNNGNITDTRYDDYDDVDIKTTAKHFFELGMRVSNPITAADRGTAEEIIINLKRVEKDYRIDLTKEIKWLRDKVKKG